MGRMQSILGTNLLFAQPKFFFLRNPIPLMDKFKFIIMTSMRLMMHVFDMARDIILIISIYHLLEGAAFIFQWVSAKWCK